MLDSVAAYLIELRARQMLGTAEDVPGSSFGGMTLCHEQRQLCSPVGCVPLGAQLYTVLARLARRPGMVVQRGDLIAAIYAQDPDREADSAEDIVRGKIREIRGIFTALGGAAEIRNERNVGYAIRVRT